MTQPPKKKHVLIRTPARLGQNELLRDFLEGYDYLSWANRAACLDLIISQPEFCAKIEATAKSLLGQNGPPVAIERIINSAKLEMHFAAYHSTESLLGLLFAFTIDPSYPWVWLTKYRFEEYNALVSKLAKVGLAMFNPRPDAETFAKFLFFNSTEPRYKTEIDRSAKFAITYFKMLANEFQDRADYNSYKHGLRTLAPHEFKAKLESETKQALLNWDELTTTYLVLMNPVKWKSELVSDLHVVYKAIDHERSKRIIIMNTHLMYNLFQIQKALVGGTKQAAIWLSSKEGEAFDVLRPTKTGNILNKMTISPEPLNQKPK